MIYLDSSVALAHLLAEDRRPPEALWSEDLVASRLVEYEVWNRLHRRGLGGSHEDITRLLLARLAWVEMRPDALDRATRPFPVPVRTLDALHLSTVVFLRERGHPVRLATYDARMREAAEQMHLELVDLG